MLKPIKTDYKRWTFVVKTAKNTMNVHIQKKLVLTLDKIAKIKSKYAECLIDEINDQYDLEQFVKHFLLYWCIL